MSDWGGGGVGFMGFVSFAGVIGESWVVMAPRRSLNGSKWQECGGDGMV